MLLKEHKPQDFFNVLEGNALEWGKGSGNPLNHKHSKKLNE